MAGARIQVLYGYTSTGSLRPSPVDGDQSARFGWRLIGGNNRELARGAQSASSYADLCEVVNVLRVGLYELQWPIQNNARTGKWQWHAEQAGIAVMVGGRAYERERDCRDSIRHVRIAFVDATVTPGVTVIRAQGATGGHRPLSYRNEVPLSAP